MLFSYPETVCDKCVYQFDKETTYKYKLQCVFLNNSVRESKYLIYIMY